MITIHDVEHAHSVGDLAERVERAVAERHCALNGFRYSDAAAWFEEEAPKAGNGEAGMRELADLLRAADKRRVELA